MNPYEFRKYEEIFPALYKNEERRVKKVIPKNSIIEHIGSTAVPGLPGKGIIDLMVSCPKTGFKKIKKALETLGYEEGSFDENRLFLRRDARAKGVVRRFHVHVISTDNLLWHDALSFRNYLIKNPSIANEYAELKKKAVIDCNNDGKIYRSLKDAFINKHLAKARKYTHMPKTEFKIDGEQLLSKVKSLIHEGNIRRIIIKNENGETLIEIPLTIGAIGAVLVPALAAVGAIAALVTHCTIVVEKK